MSRSFTIENLSFAISLNERTIYIKVCDNVNYMSYESNIELKELRVSLDLDDAYKIIVKCIECNNYPESNYTFKSSINSSILKLSFSARVEGFLKINFDIILREKIMSNDGQLTLNFNRIEQKQTMAIEALTKRCVELEDALETQQSLMVNEIQKLLNIINKFEVFIAPSHRWTHYSQKTWVANISSTTLEVLNTDDAHFVPRNINSFYQLQKLIFRTWGHVNLQEISNETVSEMEIYCGGDRSMTGLIGIENFPNLETLTVVNSPCLTNVVKVLTESKHRIKTLKFQACTSVNVVELQTYCQVNGIFLALS